MTATSLRDCLETLRTDGWFQGYAFWNTKRPIPSGSHCMITVLPLDYANDLNILAQICEEQFPERVHPEYGNPAGLVVSVNNHLDTTFEDVEMLMEKAAVRAEELLG